MPIQVIDIQYSPILPFTVSAWTGAAVGGVKNAYYVNQGTVLSTFSYDTGTFIQIQGDGEASYSCNQAFDFQANHKVYIEFTILPNLQVSGASIFCERVGNPDPNSVKELYPPDWPSYPSLIHTEPKDVYDKNGKITILRNGKRQGKAYALLAYRSDDDEQNGQLGNQDGLDGNLGSQTGNTGAGGFSVIQSFNSDIIMMQTSINGTPCTVPMPYLKTTNQYKAVTSP